MQYRCSRCIVLKHENDFPPSDKSWCRECRRDVAREKRGGVKSPRQDLPNGNRICFKCKQEKNLAEFVKDKRCKGGYTRKCKNCVYSERDPIKEAKFKKASYEKNKEKYIKRIKLNTIKYLKDGRQTKWSGKWAKENKDKVQSYKHNRRARIAGNGRNDLTPEQIKQVKSTGRCFYCQLETSDLCIEHQVPLSRGGENTLSNVVASCRSCNNRKNNKTPEEFKLYKENNAELRNGISRGS